VLGHARSLTVFLLRDGIQDADTALRESSSLKLVSLSAGAQPLGTICIQPSAAHPPGWGDFFEGYLDLRMLGQVASSAAVLLIHVGDRTFAVTFGHGRHLLQPGVWEERFGLRVVLNSIDDHSLRSIDKRTFDAISTHSRVQSGQEAGALDFGLDVEQDLLRAATGTPSNEVLGRRLSGADSLHAAVHTELAKLPQLLEIYLARWSDETYRTAFPWVDHIAEVTNTSVAEALNDVLTAGLAAGSLNHCWLAVPEIIDWENTSGFRYGFRQSEPEHHDIHLDDFLKTLGRGQEIDLALLKRRQVNSVDPSGLRLNAWPVYQCIYCELEHNGEQYMLTGGKWYRVGSGFVELVNGYASAFPVVDIDCSDYDDTCEGAFCKRVCSEDSATFALMDRKLISIGGGYSTVEFCDLYTKNRDIIHVKRYGASSVLSHLFAQGVVSGEAFRSDADFRHAVNDILPPSHQIASPDEPPDPSAYRVVFAIVSDEPEGLTLPFFSKVNLKHAATRLQAFGYRTALAKIPVSSRMARTKKYASR